MKFTIEMKKIDNGWLVKKSAQGDGNETFERTLYYFKLPAAIESATRWLNKQKNGEGIFALSEDE